MTTKTFKVPNIGCDGCVNAVKGELSELDGVTSVDGVVDTKMVTVTYADPATWQQIAGALKEIDYAPEEA